MLGTYSTVSRIEISYKKQPVGSPNAVVARLGGGRQKAD